MAVVIARGRPASSIAMPGKVAIHHALVRYAWPKASAARAVVSVFETTAREE